MKVFWAWQSDHPRNISRDVIREALEEAIDHLKESREVVEAPEQSRGEIHLDHDTKGLTGSPDVARSILEKIAAAKVFVGDVTPVGKSPDKVGNEGTRPGRPLINSNVAIEYGYAMHKLGDNAIIGVTNTAFGRPEDLPFDIIHKRFPVQYQLVEEATKAEIDVQRKKLRADFIFRLKGFLDNPEPVAVEFQETQPQVGKAIFSRSGEKLGHCREIDAEMYLPFWDVLYLRLIPTRPLKMPLSERRMMDSASKWGAMGGRNVSFAFTNQYGAISIEQAGNTPNIDSLTQYFPNGEVWAINADIMRQGDNGQNKHYLSTPAENAFMEGLEHGLQHMKDIGAEFPIKVVAGVVGFKGRLLTAHGVEVHRFGRMVTNDVEVTRWLHDDSLEAQDKFLELLYSEIFAQSGNVRPKGLNGFPKA
ncbi:hypothetical protein [Bradyrhizobium diazoefficiens]|uniref:Uncharacterized protein n=1 Tax=Bradyrhizobium diazoefficiens TaxID=1355477 RepID=A0A810C954_9BRAD|nr:hypothetical protein XF9B_52220 [Bradyrhizobium diazoefficiens]BCF01299.1 hypothetical protein XF11B_53190 [Bradyrhizobium diazoefficiens]BCF09886.1 hypothetical protein XF12B_52590 [Bradyrhizobium diazoefficiens]BCF62334.1 hypothetical protein XF18B_52820 [Bradyrhizobium diazoefficiens]